MSDQPNEIKAAIEAADTDFKKLCSPVSAAPALAKDCYTKHLSPFLTPPSSATASQQETDLEIAKASLEIVRDCTTRGVMFRAEEWIVHRVAALLSPARSVAAANEARLKILRAGDILEDITAGLGGVKQWAWWDGHHWQTVESLDEAIDAKIKEGK